MSRVGSFGVEVEVGDITRGSGVSGKPQPRTPGKEHPKPNLPGPYPPNLETS